MNKIAERKKLRREYLKRKSAAIASAGIAGTAVVPCALLAALLTAFAFVLFLTFLLDLISSRPKSAPILVTGFVCLGLGLINGILAGKAWLCVRKSQQDLAHLTYVPPMTPEMLPAEEVLVRGADVPTVQSETLLRAAQDHETPQEELLRVSKE